MSNILDRVFNEVCLDERIPDGIFRMENEEHMNALRDYFIKKGITKEAAIHVTNRMIEGKYPERQAFRSEDGILVTFPSPQHKAKAMQKNPGKYTDKDPRPKSQQPKEEPKIAPPGSKPEPGEKPAPEKPDKDMDDKKSLPKSSAGEDEPKISQGDKKLNIEPPRGEEKPEPAPPVSPTPAPVPRTPERIAAEKEIVRQIMNTDDSVLTNVASPLSINEKALSHQLNELYKKADEWGFHEAITFLTPYIKP